MAARRRLPLLPWFVVGFLVTMVIRSSVDIPSRGLDALKTLQDIVLACALFALGTGVRIRQLSKVGGGPFILAAVSWTFMTLTAFAGVSLLH